MTFQVEIPDDCLELLTEQERAELKRIIRLFVISFVVARALPRISIEVIDVEATKVE